MGQGRDLLLEPTWMASPTMTLPHDELIAIGETIDAAALPALKKRLGIMDAEKSAVNGHENRHPQGVRPAGLPA